MTTILRKRFSPIVLLAVALGIFFLLWPARRLQSENFVFYLPNQHKLIPLQKVGSVEYLPLIPVLNLRGPVKGLQEKRNSLKVWVGSDQLQFQLNKAKVQINKTTVFLKNPILRIQGEWMAPEGFLTGVFARMAGATVVYRAGSDRAFLGGVHPISYTVRLESQPSGARLVVQFTGKVAAETASRNSKWLIYLGSNPVEPMEQTIRFENPYLKELQFDDQDGRPKLIITPNVTGLNFYPVMTDGQQVLVADFRLPKMASAPSSSSGGRPPAGAPSAPSSPSPAAAAATAGAAGASRPARKEAGAATATQPAPPPPLPVIVLDAGHGGQDTGARSRDGILEKNLAASLVAQVSGALQASQKVRVILARAGDSDPTIEERTITANTARPIAFLTFHAGEMGGRSPVIRVYTYQPSSPGPAPASGTPPPPEPSLFVPWSSAQQSEQTRSQQLAQDLAQRFAAIQGAAAPAPMPAPVRQLRSVAAPAVAIELGTLSPESNAGALNQPAFQKQVANATAAALLQFVGGAAKP